MLRALPLLLLLAPLAASCLAPVEDDPVGDAEEPGVSWGEGAPGGAGTHKPDFIAQLRWWMNDHHGQCADACFDAYGQTCSGAEVCEAADAEDYDVMTCADHVLTCGEARAAQRGDLTGLTMCWRSCEGLR